MNITQQQYRTILQPMQDRYIRLELLNYQFQTVDELSGVCIGGNITIDATSDIRRTGNLQIVVKNSSFEIQPGGKIWLDKYIKVWVGIRSTSTGKIEWTNCGIFIIDAPTYDYNPNTYTLSLSLLDLMAKLTGTRNGYLKGVPVQLKAGENIRKAIIDTLKLGGFTKYVVEQAPLPSVIPNDMEFSQGTTVYEILTGLRDLYPDYEMFFDVNGTFFYKRIPTGEDEPIIVNDDLWDKIVLSENLNTDFQNVKNSIEVYGRIHEPEFYSPTTVVDNSKIKLTIAEVVDYSMDVIYGFTIKNTTDIVNPSLRINNLWELPILTDDKKGITISASENGEEVYYCVQFKNDYWRWLGHLQAYGFAEDNNKKSPFYVKGPIGRIRLPLFDGEFSNCLTDDLAQQRAKYELWKHTNLNNVLNITTLPIPWLDVNTVVEKTYTGTHKDLFIIKNISYGLGVGDSCTISMIKFYPE